MKESIPIEGVSCTELLRHTDGRGCLTEIFRQSWLPEEIVQWNLIRNSPASLRGMRVHVVHTDYVVPVDGSVFVALTDLRKKSNTYLASWTAEFGADHDSALVIPPGVAHGFLSMAQSCQLVAVSRYWDPADELGCNWRDPKLGISWPIPEPLVSESDRQLPGLQRLLDQLEDFQASFITG